MVAVVGGEMKDRSRDTAAVWKTTRRFLAVQVQSSYHGSPCTWEWNALNTLPRYRSIRETLEQNQVPANSSSVPLLHSPPCLHCGFSLTKLLRCAFKGIHRYARRTGLEASSSLHEGQGR